MRPQAPRVGLCLITALVAAGVWYANCPDLAHQCVARMGFATESEDTSSAIFVRKVSWSADSRKLLSLAHGEVGLDGPLVLHDLDDCPRRTPIDVSGESLATAVLSPDGRHVLVATYEGRLWWVGLESDDKTLLCKLPGTFGFSAAALTADGRQGAAAGCNGSIYLWDRERQACAIFATGLESQVSNLRFSNDGRWLVAARQDGWLCAWELQSGQVLQKWQAHDQPAMAAAFLADERIISAGLDDTIRIWSMATGKEHWRGEFGLFRVNALAVSTDGKLAAWGGHQHKIVVWDLEKARKKYEIQVPTSIVWDAQFSPDNTSLAVAGNEGLLRVYAAQTGTERESIELGQRL